MVAKDKRVNELSQEVAKLKSSLEKDAATHAGKQADWQREVLFIDFYDPFSPLARHLSESRTLYWASRLPP
jgi:hypothetical protein